MNTHDPIEDLHAVVRDEAGPAAGVETFWRVAAQAATIGIFVILFGTALEFARVLLLPVTAAIVIGTMLGPISARAAAHGIPQWLTAVVLLAGWTVGADVVTAPRGEALIDVPFEPMGVAFSRMVAAYPDHYVAASPTGESALSAAPSLPAGVRVLTTAELSGQAITRGLLTPLATGGSLVYLRHPDAADLAALATTERITHTYAVEVPGLPQL